MRVCFDVDKNCQELRKYSHIEIRYYLKTETNSFVKVVLDNLLSH